MFFRRIFAVFFLMLLFFGAFGVLSSNRGQEAYMQGYVAGQQSVVQGEDGAVTAVSPAPLTTTSQSGFSGFRFFALFILGGMFLFGMMMFFGFMKMMCGKRGWREKGWHHGKHWGNWQPKGDKEQWYDEHGASEEPVMKA